jgi:hypothetical protein
VIVDLRLQGARKDRVVDLCLQEARKDVIVDLRLQGARKYVIVDICLQRGWERCGYRPMTPEGLGKTGL